MDQDLVLVKEQIQTMRNLSLHYLLNIQLQKLWEQLEIEVQLRSLMVSGPEEWLFVLQNHQECSLKVLNQQ